MKKTNTYKMRERKREEYWVEHESEAVEVERKKRGTERKKLGPVNTK